MFIETLKDARLTYIMDTFSRITSTAAVGLKNHFYICFSFFQGLNNVFFDDMFGVDLLHTSDLMQLLFKGYFWSLLKALSWSCLKQILFHSCSCVSSIIMVAIGSVLSCDQQSINVSNPSTGCQAPLPYPISSDTTPCCTSFFCVWRTNSFN